MQRVLGHAAQHRQETYEAGTQRGRESVRCAGRGSSPQGGGEPVRSVESAQIQATEIQADESVRANRLLIAAPHQQVRVTGTDNDDAGDR